MRQATKQDPFHYWVERGSLFIGMVLASVVGCMVAFLALLLIR